MLDHYLKLGDASIEIRYVDGEREFAELALESLNDKLPSLMDTFQIPGAFPAITVVLVPDRNEFDRLVRDLLQVEIEIPSHPARIAQPQRTDMIVLSPSAYAAHSPFSYVPDDFRRLLVHELVHMMEELLTPDMEVSPRWWSEGLAVFLSEQCRYEDGFRQPAVYGVAQDAIPSLSQIEADVTLAYDWGWTIVAFIEAQYGKDMIVRIVKACADGDVLAFLEGDRRMIEKCWQEWLTQCLQIGRRG